MRLTTSPFFSTAAARKIGVFALLAVSAALLSGCETDGVPSNPVTELANYSAKKDAPAKPADPPMTHTRAAMECWMKTEGNKAIDSNLDKRADIVTKCIDEKMKAAKTASKS